MFLENPQRVNAYSYSLNNPYKFIDSDGKDIAFAVDPRAAGGNGHTSFYFQNSKGRWLKFDQGAAGGPSSGLGNLGFLSGSNAPAGASIGFVDGPPMGAIIINTSSDQDKKITLSVIRAKLDHNDGTKKYNLYRNNCTDAAVDAVNSSGSGLEIPNSPFTVRPNSWYKDTKKWAENRKSERKDLSEN